MYGFLSSELDNFLKFQEIIFQFFISKIFCKLFTIFEISFSILSLALGKITLSHHHNKALIDNKYKK
jgi:hypothetical protein